MKIMHTTVNCIDFQSRIVEIDTTWKDFKEYIYSHIYDGIYDNDIGIKKSYPVNKGILLVSASWYSVNQNDDVHLGIEITPSLIRGDRSERVCFFVLEE